MRIAVPTALAVLCAPLALAQDAPPSSKTLTFGHPVAPVEIQEVVNIMRSAAEIQKVTADNDRATITLTAPIAQVALSEWLFHQLDYSAEAHPSGAAQYQFDDPKNPAVRVFYLANMSNAQQIQELVNVIRATAEIARITAYNRLHAIIARGSARQIELAEWVVAHLDLPGNPPVPPPTAATAYECENIHDTGVAARIFYLHNVRQPQDRQEVVNTIRSITEIQRITIFNPDSAIVVRADNQQAAAAEWLIGHLDQPAGTQPANAVEYQLSDEHTPIVELYYLAHLSNAQDIQTLINAIRGRTQIQRITASNLVRAIILRGSGNQVAQATALVQEKDKPAQ